MMGSLNLDVLFHLFLHCPVKDLSSLSQVNRNFNHLVSSGVSWREKAIFNGVLDEKDRFYFVNGLFRDGYLIFYRCRHGNRPYTIMKEAAKGGRDSGIDVGERSYIL